MITEITTGLTAIAKGVEALETIRQDLKKGQIDPEEISKRLYLILDLMLDSKKALLDAQGERQRLEQQMATLDRKKELESDIAWEPDGRFYYRKSERAAGHNIPYCPVCWTASDRATIPMHELAHGVYQCALHNDQYYKTAEAKRRQAQEASTPHTWRRG